MELRKRWCPGNLTFMFTFLLFLIGVGIAGAVGFYAGVKNAGSSKVAKFKELEDTLKK